MPSLLTGNTGRKSTATEGSRSDSQAQQTDAHGPQGHRPLATGRAGALGCERKVDIRRRMGCNRRRKSTTKVQTSCSSTVCRNTRKQVSLGRTSSLVKPSLLSIRYDDRLLVCGAYVCSARVSGNGFIRAARTPLYNRALHSRPLGWPSGSTPGLRAVKNVAFGATRKLYHTSNVLAIHFAERVTNGPFDGGTRVLANRNLFNLPREEIDSVREEASRLLCADRSESEFSSPLPAPPTRDQHATGHARDSRVWSAAKPATEASAGIYGATLKSRAASVARMHCPRCEARSVYRGVKSPRRS